MRLKELRISKNLTQTELAKKIGCNQTAIGKYERKELEPNIETLIKLTKIFSCSIDYLIGNSDDFGIVNIENNHTPKEQKLLKVFNLLDNDEQDKIIEDCEYFANKHVNKNHSQRRA